MRVLGIDTARGEGSVALSREAFPPVERSLGESPGFDRVLFQAIDELLAAEGVTLGDLDGIAASTGPGSFTGIRVGLSAAKALAEIRGCPLFGISGLRALAASIPESDSALRAPLLDARRGELFAGFYDASGAAAAKEALGDWSGLSAQIDRRGAELVTNEPWIFETGGAAAAAAGRPWRAAPTTLATTIALIALDELADGRGSRPEAVEANYIRRPNARPASQVQAAKR